MADRALIREEKKKKMLFLLGFIMLSGKRPNTDQKLCM
jgi:hypothetical protein